jgi:hypothetical protein
MNDKYDELQNFPYVEEEEIDFSIITMGMKKLPFFEDDLYLGMQAMNIGVVDSVITSQEYILLRLYEETEITPSASAHTVSALSQMWVFALYEVLRMWRDRKFEFEKLHAKGGIDSKVKSMSMQNVDRPNHTMEARKKQLLRFKADDKYRTQIQTTWLQIESSYRMIECLRLNLAKHCAPGKDSVIPNAPGYGRINMWCGALDFEIIRKDGIYETVNRRDLADKLRVSFGVRDALSKRNVSP